MSSCLTAQSNVLSEWFKETSITLLLQSWAAAVEATAEETWGLAPVHRPKKQINLIYYFWPGQRVPLLALFRQSWGPVNFRELEKERTSGDHTRESLLRIHAKNSPHPYTHSPLNLNPYLLRSGHYCAHKANLQRSYQTEAEKTRGVSSAFAHRVRLRCDCGTGKYLRSNQVQLKTRQESPSKLNTAADLKFQNVL